MTTNDEADDMEEKDDGDQEGRQRKIGSGKVMVGCNNSQVHAYIRLTLHHLHVQLVEHRLYILGRKALSTA